jgi:hypothetical protein
MIKIYIVIVHSAVKAGKETYICQKPWMVVKSYVKIKSVMIKLRPVIDIAKHPHSFGFKRYFCFFTVDIGFA